MVKHDREQYRQKGIEECCIYLVRGITIIICLGKRFNSMLNNRLDEYVSENDIISETQIGFKKQKQGQQTICLFYER